MNKTKKITTISLFIVLFFITGCSTKEQPRANIEQGNEIKKSSSNIEPATYEIVKTEDQSHKATGEEALSEYTVSELAELPIDKKMLYRVVMSPEIKENQVEPTINKIISDITEGDNDIDEISLLLYSNKDLVGGVYDVGTATWAPSGELGNITPEIAKNNNRDNYKISFKIKENLEEYLLQKDKSEDKLGLTEEKRRLIYKELANAEEKAINEAGKMFPTNITNPNYKQENIMKNFDKQEELLEKYNLEIMKKYSINEDQKNEIVVEAMAENW